MTTPKEMADTVDELLAPMGIHVDRERLAELYPDCESQGCKGDGGFRVHWPGRTTLMCEPCATRARGLASFMGFNLTVDVVPR